MEKTIKSFRKDIMKSRGESISQGIFLNYEKAIDRIKNALKEQKKNRDTVFEVDKVESKKDFYKRMNTYKSLISDIVIELNIQVHGFEKNRNDFIEKAVNRIAGFDIIQPYMDNPNITDIFIVNKDYIFIIESGEDKQVSESFKTEENYKEFIDKIVGLAKKQLNKGNGKKLDFQLFGDRYAVVSDVIASKGNAVTIRKHSENFIDKQQLINAKVLSDEMAELIDLIIEGEGNTIMGGITGAGKTTSYRALLDYTLSRNKKRTYTVEDTRELFLRNAHTLETVSIKNKDPEIAISLYDLILMALRQMPKYIIVGEVRGKEAVSAIEAMETGHSTHLTMHGGTIWNIINRLITKYSMGMNLDIKVIERMIGSAVDYIFIQTNIPNIGRKITDFYEISYDFEKEKITTKCIFEYDISKQSFLKKGNISREKANHLMRRGVPFEKLEKWIDLEKEVV